MNINPNLTAFITATGAAVAAGFVAFGHSNLSTPAQAAFVAGASLVVAVIHSGLLKAQSTAPVVKKTITTTTTVAPSETSTPPSTAA